MSHDHRVVAIFLQSLERFSSTLAKRNFIMKSLQDRSAPLDRLPLAVNVEQLGGSIAFVAEPLDSYLSFAGCAALAAPDNPEARLPAAVLNSDDRSWLIAVLQSSNTTSVR